MMTDREKIIAIIDNDVLQPSDAIILLEGDGLNRYPKAVELYKRNIASKIVFSGGIIDYNYGSFPFSDILPYMLQAGIPKSNILYESNSLNTREQAIEIVKLSLLNSWRRIVLVASYEHQYRAYLTFLREILDTKSNIILYNAPARDFGWFAKSDWGFRFERLEQEFIRIEKYSKLGHLASCREIIDYQKWKELQ